MEKYDEIAKKIIEELFERRRKITTEIENVDRVLEGIVVNCWDEKEVKNLCHDIAVCVKRKQHLAEELVYYQELLMKKDEIKKLAKDIESNGTLGRTRTSKKRT